MNGQTMLALNSLYQQNMGQRTGLSFKDKKIINLAYCSNTCSTPLVGQQCQRGGYQDPNNCSRCVCPDGFGGTFCDQLEAPTNGNFTWNYKYSKTDWKPAKTRSSTWIMCVSSSGISDGENKY
jgi:hypothetical protein